MVVGRLIGWLLLAAALVSLGWDVVASLYANRIAINALGEQWFAFDRDSLSATQRVLEANLLFLWDPLLMTLLRWPGWIVFALFGGLALLTFRRGRRRRRRDRWFIR